MAVLLDPDGTSTVVEPAKRAFTLQELYAHIGCDCVQMVRLADGNYLWVDEDGKSKDLPLNVEATILLRLAGSLPDDYVTGKALVASAVESSMPRRG